MVKMDKIVNFAMQIFNNRIESGVMDKAKKGPSEKMKWRYVASKEWRYDGFI